MNKKTYKLISIIIMAMIILCSLSIEIKATMTPNVVTTTTVQTIARTNTAPGSTSAAREDRGTSHTASEIVSEGKGFIEMGEKQAEDSISQEELKNMSNTLYNILLVTGIVIAVVMGLLLGIKFIMGSIEQKAEVKAMLVPYVIGVVVIFGAFTIWKIIVDVLQSA